MTQSVRIVTDSASDLSQADAGALDIAVVPLSIRFGDREFTDRVDLSVEDFYAEMAQSDDLPETAAPSPGAFTNAFNAGFEAGADTVICINLSSALSATMQSAQTAANELDNDVRVLDSATITAGLGSIVLSAARAAADGATADEVEQLVAELKTRTRVYGALDTLDNLKKGGRIGNAQALLGGILSIKPILDLSSGAVEEAGRQRTRKKAMAWLRDQVAEAGPLAELAIMHGQAPDVEDFRAMLEPVVNVDTIRVAEIGAVIGAHGGPRVIGVAYQLAAS
jgi:DegV family protein with EDD domain